MTQAKPSHTIPTLEAGERDRQHWAAVRTGDAVAFETLFRDHAADLVDFAISYVRTRDVAEEIVHLLFCWLWDHRHTLEEPRTVRGYLFTAIRNRSHNHLRDERTRFDFLDRVAARSQCIVGMIPATDAATLTSDLEASVDRCLAELPPRCKEVFALVRDRAMSHAEAAAILGISPKTVEIHMGRALKILRARLAPWLEFGA